MICRQNHQKSVQELIRIYVKGRGEPMNIVISTFTAEESQQGQDMKIPTGNSEDNETNSCAEIPTVEEAMSLKSVELTVIPHSAKPILQFSLIHTDGTSKTEFYQPYQVNIIITEFLKIFKNVNSEVLILKVNWSSQHLSKLLTAIESQKAHLHLKCHKFVCTRPYFQGINEASQLTQLLQHFQTRTLQIASSNFSSPDLERFMATPNYNEAVGVYLNISKNVPMSKFFHIPRLRLQCSFLTAKEVYELVLNFTQRNLPRGSFFGMMISSGFDVSEMKDLLKLHKILGSSYLQHSLPVPNRQLVFHMKFSRTIAKGVVCAENCVENDFQRAQEID